MKRYLLLLLALMLPLCALADEVIHYEDVTYIAFNEPNGYSMINVGPGCTATVGQHTYLFLKATKEAARTDIIARTEAVLTALQAFGAADQPYTLHVVKGRYAPRVDGSTLYIGTASYASADYVTGLAKLVFGNGVNYGLLYGVSCEIAANLGMPMDAPPPLADALAAMTGEHRAYLDLNYACFIAPYADESMQAHVQSVARAFAAALTAEEKSALLTAYSDEAFYAQLNRFLSANGQAAYDTPLTGFSFHGGGDGSVRLRWESANARYILDSEFEDFERQDIESALGTWNPMNGSYPQLRKDILHMEEVLTFTKAYFIPYQARAPLTIWLENQNVTYKQSYNRLLASAFYDPGANTIHLGAIDSLGHETVHAIMDDTDTILALEECLAYYFDLFVLDLHNGGFPLLADAVASNRNENFLSLVDDLSELLGHPVDFYSKADYIALTEAMLVQANSANWHILSEHAFTTAASGTDTAARYCLYHYMQTTWGKELALRAIAENDPALLGASSWATLVRDWSAHLDSTYGALFPAK